MVKPDVLMVHDEAAHVFYGGRIYVVTRMATGWVLTRPMTIGEYTRAIVSMIVALGLWRSN